MRIGIRAIEHLNGIHECRANDGVATDANASRLANSELRQLTDSFMGECARSRYYPNIAFEMDMAGHDTDLAFAGRDYARAVRSDQAGLLALQKAPGLNHVNNRNTLSDADDQREGRHQRLP